MNRITESSIGQYSIDLPEEQGFDYIHGQDIAPGSETPARQNFEFMKKGIYNAEKEKTA